MTRRRTPVVAAVMVLGLLAAGCSGSDKKSSSTTTSDFVTVPTTQAPTTPAPTTAAPSTAAPTTPAPGPAVYPLTGMPVQGDPLLATHAALVVKIDNHPQANPQAGLNQADVVYEEIVEGITRFFTIFHSQVPGTVGPIRSARTQDLYLVANLNRPLFAWSGGNPTVTRLIHDGPLIDLSAQIREAYNGGGYFRAGNYKAPHNLFANGQKLLSMGVMFAPSPKPLFSYRGAGDTVNGAAVQGVDLQMFGTSAQWRWDPKGAVWLRSDSGRAHRDQAGTQINTQNVVVTFVPYKPSPADVHSPEAQTVGTGEVWVFTDGKLVKGTWTRANATDPWTFKDTAGKPILLTPGRTWVELAEQGDATVR